MKFLILIALLAIVQTAPPVPRKALDSLAQDKPSAPNTPPVDVSEKAKRDETSAPEKTPTNTEQTIRIRELPPVSVARDRADWILWLASVLLALVGISGIVFAYCTLKAIQGQTKAVLKSVIAIKRQTDVSMEAQSGRVAIYWDQIVHIDYGQTRIINGPMLHAFNWYCRNSGQTHIEILKTWCRLIIVDSLINLPEKPDYSAPNERQYIGEPLPSNADARTEWFSAILEDTGLSFHELERKYRSRECSLYAYGYVVYRNIWGKERTQRFGVVRAIALSILSDNWLPAGPRAYNSSD